jgi:hypothetical protein
VDPGGPPLFCDSKIYVWGNVEKITEWKVKKK